MNARCIAKKKAATSHTRRETLLEHRRNPGKASRWGIAIVHATIRGTTRYLKESIDSDSIASICSVALMFDRTAPIPDPTRPATNKPVTSGPISTKKASACTVGIHAVAPKVTSVLRVCSVNTAPSAKPEATTRGRDFEPTSASWRRSWSPSNGRRNTSVKARSPKRLTSPAISNALLKFNPS